MPTIFFDFDSTVCTKESLDEVIALALDEHPDKEKLVQQVEAITNQGMNGELDFKQAVTARLQVCELYKSHFETVGETLKECITPGFKDLFSYLHQAGWDVYIVSGGFLPSVLPAAQRLGLNVNKVFTNSLRLEDDKKVLEPDSSSLLWTNLGKAPVIEHLTDAKKLSHPLVLVGDGSNDLAAFTAGAVDHFVGFGGNVVRESVKQKSPHFVHSVDELKIHLQSL